ncbi:hypothetical protein ACFQFC_09965 [Amorphoplanes digitatis]|uniref:Uncharacterized protein n=1 Tax=Actinoplanes digitatis TaxID=1868 RepID=A0A7W7I1J1_9ACTN|nr:hypothetical protein [Actinoplanes digitatis]MBB4764523.1 hypothetical protein [Actinoplanes digitatis]BFE73994.1 hypothetical protein GCM10020092_072950 [Actinoplanes digitatis]GID91525.1 hypothetical protein Adi01nite_09370 [Actinoplanes digitatis]
MRVEITSSDYPDLLSLHDWIRHDPAIARQSEIVLGSSGRAPDQQGTLDVIDVVLSNATALAALAVSYATWRQARRAESRTTFRSGPHEVSVNGDEADPAKQIVEAIPPGEEEPDAPRHPDQV